MYLSSDYRLGVDALFALLCGINYGDSGAKDVGLSVDLSGQLPNSICSSVVKQELLYVVVVSTCFVSVCLFVFFSFFFSYSFLSHSNMISINTVKFKFYVVIIILVNL